MSKDKDIHLKSQSLSAMKTCFKSILSISLSFLSLSCQTKRNPETPPRETSGQSELIGNGTFNAEHEDPAAAIYGTKSFEVAFVLVNLN